MRRIAVVTLLSLTLAVAIPDSPDVAPFKTAVDEGWKLWVKCLQTAKDMSECATEQDAYERGFVAFYDALR